MALRHDICFYQQVFIMIRPKSNECKYFLLEVVGCGSDTQQVIYRVSEGKHSIILHIQSPQTNIFVHH